MEPESYPHILLGGYVTRSHPQGKPRKKRIDSSGDDCSRLEITLSDGTRFAEDRNQWRNVVHNLGCQRLVDPIFGTQAVGEVQWENVDKINNNGSGKSQRKPRILHSHEVGMSVLCEYAIVALFAYFPKVCISHIFPHKLSLSPFLYAGFMRICDRGIIRIFPKSVHNTYFCHTNCHFLISICRFMRICKRDLISHIFFA